MKKGIVIRPIPFLFQLVLSLGGGILISFLTRGSEKYQTLTKPALSPKPIVFIIAWTVFYILMAISATLVLSDKKGRDSGVIKIYYAQLFVNFLWPVLFFSLGMLELSFVCIILLIALVGYMIYKFYPINKIAALINIPYFLWLIFAAYLNMSFILLN